MVKVFLVDDEIVIREGIRNSFPWEESGYTLVGEAPDGGIALPMIRDANPDILITDIRMPFMDGMQLCREVKRQMPWIGVVILSGYDDFTYARQAISLGVKEYLLKPVTAQELKEVLDRISARLTEERRAREDMALMRRRLHSGSQFVKEKLLSSLFTDEPMEDGDADAMIEQMRTLGINLAAKCYAVIDMAFSCADGSRSVPRAALYALAEGSGGIVQVCAAKHGARALVLGDSEDDTEDRAYSFASSALNELERSGCTGILLAIGEIVSRFADIRLSMRSARHTRHLMAARPGAGMRIMGVREAADTPDALKDLDLRPLHERLQYAAADELDQVFGEYVASLGAADLHSADFRQRRAALFEACLGRLEDGSYRDAIRCRYRDKFGLQSPFVYWELLGEELLEQALDCLPAAHLRAWFERLLEDIPGNRAGLPDLIQFWPAQRRYRMVEVKGSGDRLQDNQLRWLQFCREREMPVAVCYVRWHVDD